MGADVQWYPGHMTRARRKIEDDVKLVDLVIEILDARCPRASENPDIRRITKGKQRLVLLNKADLADDKATEGWVRSFDNNGTKAIALDSRSRSNINRIKRSCEDLMEEKRKRDLSRGIAGRRALRALVCGIPNVGKSTLINSFSGRASAKTGDTPGVTRGSQWINVDNLFLLLDTPGVLWPRFNDKRTAFCLAATGAISGRVMAVEEICVELLNFLLENYREELFKRYGITEAEYEEKAEGMEITALGVKREPLAVFDLIALKRGCLKKKAEPDYGRAAGIILDDFRSGRTGKISLERV